MSNALEILDAEYDVPDPLKLTASGRRARVTIDLQREVMTSIWRLSHVEGDTTFGDKITILRAVASPMFEGQPASFAAWLRERATIEGKAWTSRARWLEHFAVLYDDAARKLVALDAKDADAIDLSEEESEEE